MNDYILPLEYSDDYRKKLVYKFGNCTLLEYVQNLVLELKNRKKDAILLPDIIKVVFVTLCKAVLFLYKNSLYHCDIKPENIALVE